MIALIILVLLALALSAFFSAAELAFFSLGDNRLRAYTEAGRGGSAALQRLRERPERLLVLLRLGDALADVTVAATSALIGLLLGGTYGLIAGGVVAGILILLVGELGPLRYGATQAANLAFNSAPSLLLLSRILSPFLIVLERLGRVVPDWSSAAVGNLTETEIRELTMMGHADGALEEHERQLIERAFRLDETKVWDIMTPRVDIFAWRDSLRVADIASQLSTISYSRVPVYGESVDDITGILYVRDLYQALVAGQRDVPLRALAREPLIVPGSLSVSRLLRDFQSRRIHLALVVDEYGGTDGLVTLEDAIEELVGEIVDETDVAEEPVVRISRHEVEAAGDADLREINHFFNTSFPQLEHRSLNGYLLEELGRVPTQGETLEREGVAIEVVEATETQVLRARLRRQVPLAELLHPPDEAPPADTPRLDDAEAGAGASRPAPGSSAVRA